MGRARRSGAAPPRYRAISRRGRLYNAPKSRAPDRPSGLAEWHGLRPGYHSRRGRRTANSAPGTNTARGQSCAGDQPGARPASAVPQDVAGQFHLAEMLGDLFEHVQQRMALRGELQLIGALAVMRPAARRRRELGRGRVGTELPLRVRRRGDQPGHRAMGTELRVSISGYHASRYYLPAPEFHDAKAMSQDRIRRIRARQYRLMVSEIVAESGDNCGHLVHRAVHVAHDRVYRGLHQLIMAQPGAGAWPATQTAGARARRLGRFRNAGNVMSIHGE